MTSFTTLTATRFGGTAHRVVFGVFALVLVALELLSIWDIGTINVPTAIWLVVGYGLLAFTGWMPLVGGTLYTVATLVAIVAPSQTLALAFPLLGVFIVGGEWISRGWYAAAGVVLAITATVDAMHSGSPVVSLAGMTFGIALSVTLGLALRWNTQRLGRLRDQADSARRAAESAQLEVRREIASTLHDTLASDLTRLIVGTQSLSRTTTDPLAAEDSQALTDTARQAMVHLRALMASALPDQQGEPEPLREVIATCTTMLAGRDITLGTRHSPDVEVGLTKRQRTALALVVREGTTNVLKFARAGSHAELSIGSPHEGAVAVTLINEIDPASERSPGTLSGGFGLDNVTSRIAAEGGTVQYGSRGGSWVLAVTLPRTRTSQEGAPVEDPAPAEEGGGSGVRTAGTEDLGPQIARTPGISPPRP